MPSSLDDSLQPWVALRDPATGPAADRAREAVREALCRHYWPLLSVTAERLLKEEALDPRLTVDDYAEAALPALVVAINGYDPERRGHHGRRLQPRNWIIALIRQAMKAHSEREGHRLSLLAEQQVLSLEDGQEAIVDLVAGPEAPVVEQATVAVALARLPWLQRRVAYAVYMERQPATKVARELRLPPPVLRRYLLIPARRRLAWYLRDGGGGENAYANSFQKVKRVRKKRLTQLVTYRETPENYEALLRLAEVRQVSVAELLRQLAREAVRKEKARKDLPPAEPGNG